MAKLSLKDAGMVCSYLKSVAYRLSNTKCFNNNTYLKNKKFSARTPLAELLRKPENIQAEARLKERVASLRKYKHAPFNHFNFLG